MSQLSERSLLPELFDSGDRVPVILLKQMLFVAVWSSAGAPSDIAAGVAKVAFLLQAPPVQFRATCGYVRVGIPAV